MQTQSSIETFINRFAFNKDADIQYLFHGLTSDRPYIEKLKISISNFIKSQRIYKKSLTTVKVKTDKNIKKFTEAYDNVEIDFLKMVDLLKDTHHFLINILKIDLFTKQNVSQQDMYKNFSTLSSNFTDLVQQIDFNKKDRFVLNTFNRMRNIIIHAPSGIIIGYLTEAILEEFRVLVNLCIGISNDILTRNMESLKIIITLQQEDIARTETTGISDAKSLALKYNLTIKELLEILKNSEYDFVVDIHPDMQLDAYAKAAIIPEIEKVVNKKKKLDEEKQFNECLSKLHQSDSLLVVDFDYVLGLFSNNTNKAYNHIYELYENLKANRLSLISESKSKDVLQAIDELHFTTNNKQKIAKDCKELLEYISNSNNFDLVIAYVDNKIQNCLEKFDNDKHIIVHENYCDLDINTIKWNSIVIKNSDVIKIIQTKN